MISMTRQQYEALYRLAREHNSSEANALRQDIDDDNGIARFFLWIRWQDVTGAIPTHLNSFMNWPPEQQFLLELDRTPERNDVDAVLRDQAVNPAVVFVTPDPQGVVGWTEIENYSF